MNGEVVLGRRSARAGQIYTRQRTMPSRSQRVHGGSLRTRRRPGAMAQRSHKAWMHGRDNIFLSASFLANKLGPKIRTPAPHLRRNCSREASYDRHSSGSGGVRRRTASCVCTNVASRSFARGHNGHGERRCATLRDESMTPHEIVGTTAGEASEKVCSSAMSCVCGRTDKAPGDGGVFGSVAAAEWPPHVPLPSQSVLGRYAPTTARKGDEMKMGASACSALDVGSDGPPHGCRLQRARARKIDELRGKAGGDE